jgi:GntR family transcriptional regulator / MocR family aminotransferase
VSPRNLQAHELLLRLDRSRRTSVSRQLEEQIRSAIRSGALAAGEHLPSTRVLAEDLGVSRGVVLRAYGQLAAEGFLELRERVSPAVRDVGGVDPKTAHPRNRGDRVVYDLRPHLPEVAMFPRRAWLRAVSESLNRARTTDLTYGDGAGLWELRVVAAQPERTLITAGTTHSLSLVSRLFARRGETKMAFENPSHRLLRAVAFLGGLTVIAAAVDKSGVRPDTIDSVSSLFVAPANQFPTGVVMTEERRAEVIEWAREADALVLEDDYDSEFRYDRAPLQALQALDPERVIYLGSTGKTFIPALRLGWMVLPEELVDEAVRELMGNMLHVSGLDQLAFANFLRRGDFDRHLRRMRMTYRARRDAVVSLLEERLPGYRVPSVAAGLHAVLEVPSHAAAEAIRTEAWARGIAVESIDQHLFADYGGPAGILIGYGSLSEPTLDVALNGLVEAIRRRCEDLE